MIEPTSPRTVAFVDGQNLFHTAREAFGYAYPNYDVTALAKAVCHDRGWCLAQVRFYTGVPRLQDDPFWHDFWRQKLALMGRHGVHIFSRHLRYRTRHITLPDGSRHSLMTGEEKGIDVRIAIDIVRLAHRRNYDVALIFSQDQDLSEVAAEIRSIAREQDRWIKVASAFPVSAASHNRRGVDKTDWIPITR